MGRWGTQPQWGDGPGWDGLNSPQPPKQLGPAAPLTALQEEQVWQEIRAAVGGEEWGEEMLSYSLRAPPWQCSPLRHSLICPHHCTNANAGGEFLGHQQERRSSPTLQASRNRQAHGGSYNT